MSTKANDYENFKTSVAMTVTLVSFAMLFATLFLGYTLVRFNSPTWPPVEIQGMPQLLPFLSTVAMILSSLTYVFMERKNSKPLWVATVVLGVAFLLLQWILWGELKRSGIMMSDGQVPSMIYAFTWIHAGHIVMGLGLLMWLGHYFWRGRASQMMITNVGKFWHFLGVVWLVMYLTLFVV